MVEGGGELLGTFLAERILDQVALFRAPLLLGGRGSRPAFGGPDPSRLSDALPLKPAASPGRGGRALAAADSSSTLPRLFEIWYPRMA